MNVILLEFSDGVFVLPDVTDSLGIIRNRLFGLPVPNTYDDEYLEALSKKSGAQASGGKNFPKKTLVKKVTSGGKGMLQRSASTTSMEKLMEGGSGNVNKNGEINIDDIKACVIK